MSSLKNRLPTAIIFGIVVIGSIYFSHLTFGIVFLFFVLAGIWEFYQLFDTPSHIRTRIFGLSLAALGFGLTFVDAHLGLNPKWYFMLVPGFFLLFFFNLYQQRQQKTNYAPFINIIGVVYVTLPFSLLNFLLYKPDGSYYPFGVLGLIFLIWANDSFAYLSGSQIGKNKLFERISPGKSWEGFIGGLAATMVVGYLLGLYLGDGVKWMIFAFMVSVFGTIGDLVESHMKRLSGKKDSGTILPGHGGVLDRFDGLIFALPFVYLVELLYRF